MKFSESWLRELTNPDKENVELAAQLTMAGFEVKSMEDIEPAFSGVVAAKVISSQPHPSALNLHCCEVSDGQNSYQIVCGAANIRPGMTAALARVGAVLPNGKTIRGRNVKGICSQGMLCSAAELGLVGNDDGLLELLDNVGIGMQLREFPQYRERIFDIDVTFNRSDCLSHYGLAREIAALNGLEMQPIQISPPTPVLAEGYPIEIEDFPSCPRYLGCVIRNLDLERPTPSWMAARLHRCGVRSMGPGVDITNYVTVELGQPMHAFDLDLLSGKITVRQARSAEPIRLLNDNIYELHAGTLVIADDSGPIAMAGIMGGAGTAVRDSGSATTRNLFLECASFQPAAIAGQARVYGLHTEASYRYERGVDSQLAPLAMARAVELLTEIAGGEPGHVIDVSSPRHLPTPPRVALRSDRLESLLGISLDRGQVREIFQRLDFQLHAEEMQDNRTTWILSPPSRRFDIAEEADLIEEVARIHGYDRIPFTLPMLPAELSSVPESRYASSWLRAALMHLGYQEIISYSFVAADLLRLCDPEATPIGLVNPISQTMAVMRSSLLPGLLHTAITNLSRQQNRLLFFEIGKCFYEQAGEIVQTDRIGGLISGLREEESWLQSSEYFDFYDLKGQLETLLAAASLRANLEWRPSARPCLHPGQSAELLLAGASIGHAGRLHPRLAVELDLQQAVYVFELELDAACKRPLPQARPVSSYPCVRRDIAMLVDRDIPAETICRRAVQAAGPLLESLRLFDVYTGNNLESNQKSVALGLIFQHQSKTLSSEEVQLAVQRTIRSLVENFSATMRE